MRPKIRNNFPVQCAGWVPGLQRIQMDIDGLGTMLVLASARIMDTEIQESLSRGHF